MSLIEPVDIVHTIDHKFVKNGGRPRGCNHLYGSGQTCGRAKNHPLHYGAVPSLNQAGSGGNHFVYQNAKKALQEALTALLVDSQLPKDLTRIVVEGEMCFPDQIRRDQGNYRYFIEKCLGDALVAGGWLPDDSWDEYEFGGLAYRYVKGESWTRLMIFPVA